MNAIKSTRVLADTSICQTKIEAGLTVEYYQLVDKATKYFNGFLWLSTTMQWDIIISLQKSRSPPSCHFLKDFNVGNPGNDECGIKPDAIL